MTDKEKAEAEGYIVDTHCYPWFAYKDPRFRPTESRSIRTDLECANTSLRPDEIAALGLISSIRVRIKKMDDLLHDLAPKEPNADEAHGEIHELAYEFEQVAPACLSATSPGADVVRTAIVSYCNSQSRTAVQNSHGQDRIYYSGLSVDDLTSAIINAIQSAAQGGGTKSDGEGKVGSSPALASEGQQRVHEHGVMPVGDIAANMDSIGAGPSDPAQEPEAVAPSGLPYGIIDPDYARFFTDARLVCWSYGYALAMHGSFTRDLDLIAMPWTETACDADKLIQQIEYRTEWKRLAGKERSDREHGRMVWTLTSPKFNCSRFVDFSVVPRTRPVSLDREALFQVVFQNTSEKLTERGIETQTERITDAILALIAEKETP